MGCGTSNAITVASVTDKIGEWENDAEHFKNKNEEKNHPAVLKDRELRQKEKGFQAGTKKREEKRKDEKKGMSKKEFVALLGENSSLGFDLLDYDLTGHMDREKWLRGFETVDKDGDELITQKEFEEKFGSGSWSDEWLNSGSEYIDQASWLNVLGWYGRRKNSIVGMHQSSVKTKDSTKQTAVQTKEMSKKEFNQKVQGVAFSTDRNSFAGQVLFKDFDADDSGKLDLDEWIAAFDRVAVDGKTEITREEWEAKFGRGTFTKWDADGNGAIDKDEWIQIFHLKRQATKKK